MIRLKTIFGFILCVMIASCGVKNSTSPDGDVVVEGAEDGIVTEAGAKAAEKESMPEMGLGSIAAPFNLKNIDGEMVSFESFPEAKGYIVIFTCNHCPFSVATEDRIIALDKKFKSKGFPVIAINPNNPESYPSDSYENMIVRAKEKGFTFPYLMDEGQKIYPKYGATKTPHVFIVNKEEAGNVIRYIGAIDNNVKDGDAADQKYVEMAVEALMNGKSVKVKQTKAIGCGIKA